MSQIRKFRKDIDKMQQLLDKREPQKALDICEMYLQRDPENKHLLNIKAESLVQLKKYDEAISIIQKMSDKTPKDPGLWSNLAMTYRMSRNIEKAIEAQEKAVALTDNNPNLIFTLANLNGENKDYDNALKNFKKTDLIAPKQPQIRFNIADILVKKSLYIEALKNLEGIPENLSIHFLYLQIYIKLNWYHKARYHIEQLKGLVKKSGTPDLIIYIHRLLEVGLINDAREHLSKIEITNDANYLQALLWCGKLELPLLEKIENTISALDVRDAVLKNLYFSLSENFADVEQQKSFKYLHLANKINHQKLVDKRINYTQEFEKIRLDISNLPKLIPINDSKRPVFIVGMPRSGTTLVESILAAHSEGFGAGEVPYLTRLINQSLSNRIDNSHTKNTVYGCMSLLEKWQPNDFEQLTESYMKLLGQHSNKASRIIDKFTHNFLHIAIIHKIFPNAKIIHCKRHPVANCISIYKQNLRPHHSYASDFNELIEYYKLYQNLMNFWSEQLPELNMKTIQYEDLVQNFEPEVRKLLDYCELPFEEACLNFHENKRIVSTLSYKQVRKEVNDQSLKPWAGVESEYQPLIDAFGVD